MPTYDDIYAHALGILSSMRDRQRRYATLPVPARLLDAALNAADSVGYEPVSYDYYTDTAHERMVRVLLRLNPLEAYLASVSPKRNVAS